METLKKWLKKNWVKLAVIGGASVLAVVIAIVGILLLGGGKNGGPNVSSPEGPAGDEVCTHVWGEADIIKEATCLNNGKVRYSCTLCDETYEEEVPQAACDYEKTVAQVTCLQDGAEVYTCSVCGDSYKQVTTRAVGHNAEGAIWTQEDDVQVEGCLWQHVETAECTICGEEVVHVSEFYKHNYSMSVDTYATCMNAGLKVYQCEDCEDYYEEAYTDANAHTWDEGENFGSIVIQSCACGEEKKFVDARNEISTTVSSSDLQGVASIALQNAEISMDNDALSGLTGDISVSVETVSKDDITLTADALEKLGDAPIFDFNMSAGGNAIANFNGKLTVTIPYELQDGDDLDNIAVAYINDNGELEYFSAVYSYADGQGYATFTTDHFSYYTVVRMTPAERCALYGCKNTITVVAPSCGVQGYTLTECSRCHKATRTDFMPADTHSYTKATTPATCSGKGYSVYTCSKCGDKYTSDFTAKLAHSYKANVVEATCTADGYTVNACEHCGVSYVSNKTSAKGHNYENDICKNCGKKDPNATGNFYLNLLESAASADTYYFEVKDVSVYVKNDWMEGTVELDLARLMIGFDETGLIGKGEGTMICNSNESIDFPDGEASVIVVFANGKTYIQYEYDMEVELDTEKDAGYIVFDGSALEEELDGELDGSVLGMMSAVFLLSDTWQNVATELWDGVSAVEDSPLNKTMKAVIEYAFKKEATENGYNFTLNYDKFLEVYGVLKDDTMAMAYDLVFGTGAFLDTVNYLKASLTKTVPQFEADTKVEFQKWGISLDEVYDMINDVMAQVTGSEGDIREYINVYETNTISEILDMMMGAEGADYTVMIDSYASMMQETTFLSAVFDMAGVASGTNYDEIVEEVVNLLRPITISFATDKGGALLSVNMQAKDFSFTTDGFGGKGESENRPEAAPMTYALDEDDDEYVNVEVNGSFSIVLNGSYMADYGKLVQKIDTVSEAYKVEKTADMEELAVFNLNGKAYLWGKKTLDNEDFYIRPTRYEVGESIGTGIYNGQPCTKYALTVYRLYELRDSDVPANIIHEDCLDSWKIFDGAYLDGFNYNGYGWVNAEGELVGIESLERADDGSSYYYYAKVQLYYNIRTGEYTTKTQHNLKLVSTKAPNGCAYGERLYECSICGHKETEYYGRGHVTSTRGELVAGATSCKQGAVITEYCTECNEVLSTYTTKYHSTYYFKEHMGKSLCGNIYIEGYRCVCGEENSVNNILSDCLFDSVDWEHIDDAEHLNVSYHLITTYRCAVNACAYEYTVENIDRHYQQNGKCYSEYKYIYTFGAKSYVRKSTSQSHWTRGEYTYHNNGRTSTSTYWCRLCGMKTDEWRYDTYGRTIYRYDYENNYGYQREFIYSDDPCRYLQTTFGESGKYEGYEHLTVYYSDKESCTQYSRYGIYCELCNYQDGGWYSPDYWAGDNGHNWWYSESEETYICRDCGTRSSTGANGLISLEDMFEKGVWKVGYYNYRGCDMSSEVDVEIIVNYQEDGSGIALKGNLFTMTNTTPANIYDYRETGILTVDMDALREAIRGMDVETISVVFWVLDESKTATDENGNPKEYYLAHAITFDRWELGL